MTWWSSGAMWESSTGVTKQPGPCSIHQERWRDVLNVIRKSRSWRCKSRRNVCQWVNNGRERVELTETESWVLQAQMMPPKSTHDRVRRSKQKKFLHVVSNEDFSIVTINLKASCDENYFNQFSPAVIFVAILSCQVPCLSHVLRVRAQTPKHHFSTLWCHKGGRGPLVSDCYPLLAFFQTCAGSNEASGLAGWAPTLSGLAPGYKHSAKDAGFCWFGFFLIIISLLGQCC